MKRLVDEQAPLEQLQAEAKRVELFKEAALRIVEESSIASKSNRRGRLRLHVFDHIGKKPVTEITASDVREVLQAVADKCQRRDVVVHVKNDIGAVFGELYRAEVLPENVVSRVRVPKAKVDTRELAVLTDEELAVYLAWKHPSKGYAMAVLERQTVACLVPHVRGGPDRRPPSDGLGSLRHGKRSL